MESRAKRPTAVTMLGWIFLVLAALYVPLTFWRWSPSSAWPPRAGAPWYDWFNAVWHPYVCVLWSIFVAASAVQFLRLRAWARTALEVVAWLPLVLAGGHFAVAVLLWLPSDPGLGLVSTIIALVFGVVVGVPCVIIIRLLRSPGVRGAMMPGRSRGGAFSARHLVVLVLVGGLVALVLAVLRGPARRVSTAPVVDAGTWVRVGERRTWRTHYAVAAAHGKLYLAGGLDGQARRSSALESYDPKRGRWQWHADMPTARMSLAAAIMEGKLYAVGGADSQFYSGALEVYDPGTDEWTRFADMPTARSDLGIATIDGRLYAVGGLTYERGFAVEVYDPETDRWRRAANMIAARTAPGVGAVDGKLYAFGGNRFGGPTWEVYDCRTNEWTAMPEPPFTANASGAGLAAVGDRLYVVGVTYEQMLAGSESLCHVYDARTAQWERLPDLPAVAGLQMPANNSVVAMEGKPYVVGGVCDMKRLRTAGSVILAGGVTTIDVLEPD